MGEWLPIESAPRDGTYVLTYEDGYIAVTRMETLWNGERRWVGGSYGDPPPAPTHWMPLPAPPETR